jgi:hypothetical protein
MDNDRRRLVHWGNREVRDAFDERYELRGVGWGIGFLPFP